jgi:lipoprotein-releasing system ATP-binding protein
MSESQGAAATKAKPKPGKGRLIEVHGLDKTFYDADREIRVLRNLDLKVESGEEIAVVGQSGTGKSTLLHIIGSLEEPTAGKIYFEGEDLFALDQKSLAEFRNLKLGFVFQFHYLLADFTALENVMMPALIGRVDDAEASRRATEMLEIVGLGDKLKRRPAELSGGEQQRVAVARAVVLRPKLLLADEPTGNLDPHTADGVHQLFHKLNRELGITLVIATHNEQLTRSVGRALRLVEGKLVDERR